MLALASRGGHGQPCDLSGHLHSTVTQWGRLSHGFVPGLGKALQEHTCLIMQQIIEWVQALLNGKTCVKWTGKGLVLMSQHEGATARHMFWLWEAPVSAVGRAGEKGASGG